MKVNIENCMRQATSNVEEHYKYSIKEFVEHLKMVRDEHEAGKSKEILDKFFDVYVFSDNQ